MKYLDRTPDRDNHTLLVDLEAARQSHAYGMCDDQAFVRKCQDAAWAWAMRQIHKLEKVRA